MACAAFARRATGTAHYEDHQSLGGWSKHPFNLANNALVLRYPHVQYYMNNETGERVEWGDYWARYVRRRAEEAGAEVYITDMRRSENVRSKDHAHIFDRLNLYTFVDISQNNTWAGLGQKH